MPKYIVQYEVIGYVDIEVEANSINEALASPTDRLTPSDAFGLHKLYTQKKESGIRCISKISCQRVYS